MASPADKTDVTNEELELNHSAKADPLRGEHSEDNLVKNGDEDASTVDVENGINIDDASVLPPEPPGKENPETASGNADDFAGAGDLAAKDNSEVTSNKDENSATSEINAENQEEISDRSEVAGGSGDKSDDGSGNKSTESKSESDDEWEDILGNSLLKKKVIKPGEGQETRPMVGNVVTIKTKTILLDETVVDVYDDFKFVLGDGDVLQALDLCVALMELHEEAVIATGYKYAWGDIGRKPDIPPKADLMVFVEVLQVDPSPNYSKMEVPERIKEADAKRERGNFLYRRSEYSLALNSYTKGLQIVDPENGYSDKPEILQELLELRVKLLCNTAACQNKLSAHDAAIKSCEEALKLQPTNTKALYRCGKAHEGKGDKSTAVRYLKLSLKHDDTNSKDHDFDTQMVHAELSKLTKDLKRESEKEKQIYQKMFGGPAVKKKQNSLLGSTSQSSKDHTRHLGQDDLDTATGAVSPQTKPTESDDSGSGAQSAVKVDAEKDLKKTLIHFLQSFGIVINEKDPYAIMQIQMAISELVQVLETVNQPETFKIKNSPKLEKKSNEQTDDNVDITSRKNMKAKEIQFSATAQKLKQEIKDGNGNAKLSFTGDALHETREKEIDPEIGSSVDSDEFNRPDKGRTEGSWLWAAAGGAVAAAAVSIGVYRYMNH